MAGAPASSAPAETASRADLHGFNPPAHGVALEGFRPVSKFKGRSERGSLLFAEEHVGVPIDDPSGDRVRERMGA